MLNGISDYMPHGMCLLWEPWLVILWAGSDLLIFLAYFAIPLALLRVVRRRRDLQHRGLVLLFAAFIMLCGLTHAMSVFTLWVPAYPLQGLIKFATGAVSVATAIVLFRLVPALVAIPSPAKLEEANFSLRTEIAAHEETLSMLRSARNELEHKVEERTAELKTANAKLAVAAREAVHRSRNLIAVVSSIARQSARSAGGLDHFCDVFFGRLNALALATSTVSEGVTQASASLGDVVRKQLEPVLLTFGDRMQVEGPDVPAGPEAAQHISLALHELATNSQKYGALGPEGGELEVGWHIEATDGAERRLVFCWEETLAHPPDPAAMNGRKSGFGTRLLTEIVPAMLHGEAERVFQDGKLVYRLSVPLSAVAEELEPRAGAEPQAGRSSGGSGTGALPQGA